MVAGRGSNLRADHDGAPSCTRVSSVPIDTFLSVIVVCTWPGKRVALLSSRGPVHGGFAERASGLMRNATEPSIVARGSLAHSAARARPAPLLLKLLGGSQPHSQSRPSLDFGRDRNILVHVKTRAERTTTWIF